MVENIAHGHGAVVAQQQHPGVEGPRDGGGQDAAAGDAIQAKGGVGLDRGAGRRHALSAQHLGTTFGRLEDDRDLAAGPVQVGLDDLQGEACRHGGVEGVSAAFEYGHTGAAGQPVGGGDHTEVAAKLWSRGEAGHEGDSSGRG